MKSAIQGLLKGSTAPCPGHFDPLSPIDLELWDKNREWQKQGISDFRQPAMSCLRQSRGPHVRHKAMLYLATCIVHIGRWLADTAFGASSLQNCADL